MSSSSTLDFMSSSTALLPILPSVSELLAQERLTNLLRPGLEQMLKFLQQIHPISHRFKNLYQYKDELILLIESILQWFYLHFHSALIGEHIYGFKRTANHRLRSLILSVFLPYIKSKLKLLHEHMGRNNTDRHATYYFILQLLPKLQICIEGIGWLYRLGYGFGLTKYYSPILQLANVKLTYAKDPSPNVSLTSSNTHRYLSIISQIITYGLYLIQIVEWWNNSKQNSTLNLITHTRPMIVNHRQCPLCRQSCHIPTLIIGSGYVYCYQCINNYVEQYHRCPTSHQPVTKEHLIKISSDCFFLPENKLKSINYFRLEIEQKEKLVRLLFENSGVNGIKTKFLTI